MTDSYLTSLVSPTLAMYGAAPKGATGTSLAVKASTLFAKKPAAPAAPIVSEAPGVSSPRSAVGMGALGFVVATGVSAGVSALVGHLMYPEVGAAKFAKVGAVSYAIPAGLLLATSAIYVAQKKKSEAEIQPGSAS